MSEIMKRDQEDGDKLAKGIQLAIDKKVGWSGHLAGVEWKVSKVFLERPWGKLGEIWTTHENQRFTSISPFQVSANAGFSMIFWHVS